ncbi:unnamed protein product [Choristocarpus tenellus]
MSFAAGACRRLGQGVWRMQRSNALIARSLSAEATDIKAPMSLIKELREASGAPIMDCKNALQDPEVNMDLEKAFEWLRKKGVSKATTLADRSANEGRLVGIVVDGPRGALVEVNSETDFVARNELFQAFINRALGAAMGAEGGSAASGPLDVQELLKTTGEGGDTLADALADLVGVIRENISLKRAQASILSVEGGAGVVAGYVHGAVTPGMGKIGALVALRAASDSELSESAMEDLSAEGKSLAMHVVAAKPEFLDEASAPEGSLEKEKNFLMEQAVADGKDPKFLGKMVEGRLRKFLEEKALVMQTHMIVDGNPKVSDRLEEVGTQLGTTLSVEGFQMYSVGKRS